MQQFRRFSPVLLANMKQACSSAMVLMRFWIIFSITLFVLLIRLSVACFSIFTVSFLLERHD